jgi:hypothetical protein
MLIVLAGGGCILWFLSRMMGALHHSLTSLTIPRDGGDLALESGVMPDFQRTSLMDGLKWVIDGGSNTHNLAIPRDLVAAVQLCPWKMTLTEPHGQTARSQTTMWTAQGLLVLSSPGEAIYQRLPLLASADLVGTAKLMQRLASALQVPYLFCADAAAWKTESTRAKTRPPIRGVVI